MRSSSRFSLVLSLVALVAGMTMLAYASVPLYRMFCAVTGFGGTPKIASAAPGVAGEREFIVRFDANVSPGLPWEFAPGEREIRLRAGEERLTFYTVRNTATADVTAHATYNVVPAQAGAYFAKVECFCFRDQTLPAGKTVTMPVSFFIDPSILDDPEMKNTRTITLSYTFFPATSAQAISK